MLGASACSGDDDDDDDASSVEDTALATAQADLEQAQADLDDANATIADQEQEITDLNAKVDTAAAAAVDVQAELIAEDGAPRSARRFVFYNPPLDDAGVRESTNFASASILASLTESGLRTMAFCRARVTAELLLRYARDRVKANDAVDPAKIESYRAGYTPEERREIERRLFEGELMGLATTSAMELGVDVGGLALEDLQAEAPEFGPDVRKVLSVLAALKAKGALGGTAPSRVKRSLAAWNRRVAAW